MDLNELCLIKIGLDVKLSVKYGCNTSDCFITGTSTPQCDCASANKFTYYSAKSLASVRTSTPTDRSYTQQGICTAIPDEHDYERVMQINHII